MNHPLIFLGIAGSLRRGSFNRAALRAARALVPPDVTLETIEIGGLPLYNQRRALRHPLSPR
jgi:chromate reductase